MSKTFGDIQARYQILKGDDSVLTADTTGLSHINAAVGDITSTYPFSWTLATTTLSLSAGTATLPTDFDPTFGLEDVRISTTVLTPITVSDRDSGDDNVYWITYVPASDTYLFHSNTQTGTVTIYYHVTLSDMTLASDYCRVPDSEAVAYQAASKSWIGSERNEALQVSYQKEADRRVKAMIALDAAYGPVLNEGSILDYNTLR